MRAASMTNRPTSHHHHALFSIPHHTCVYVALALLISLFPLFGAEKVPTRGEIAEYDDPVLKEIFSAQHGQPQQPSPTAQSMSPPGLSTKAPLPSAVRQVAPQLPSTVPDPRGAQRVGTSQQAGLVNGQNVGGYGGNYGPNSGTTGYNSGNIHPYVESPDQRTPLGDLAIKGVQGLYAGVQQASRIFGLQPQQQGAFEIPLVNQAASFLGRRRR